MSAENKLINGAHLALAYNDLKDKIDDIPVEKGSGQNSIQAPGSNASGMYAQALGWKSVATGIGAHAEGSYAMQMETVDGQMVTQNIPTTASGTASHAEGKASKATAEASHAEGTQTEASADNSHAEGRKTTASGQNSHAEGDVTAASGNNSHAEGNGTTAAGNNSHAEGQNTIASGLRSHAHGYATIANHADQTVFGQQNVADPSNAASTEHGNYVEIVGNGSDGVRSNARTLDWSGNEVLAGSLTIGGNEQLTKAQLQEMKSATTEVGNLKRVIAKNLINYFDNFSAIQAIVQSGDAANFFNIGDQLMITWNDGTKDYTLPWDVVHFGDVELENGDVVPGMFIQSHYAMQGVQFDASEAIYVADAALPAGTYNFTIGTNWGTHCVAGKTYQFTITAEIPAGGQVMVSKNNDFWTWGAPDVAPTSWKVHTFSSNADTTPLEQNLAVTEGSDGTSLGSLVSTAKYAASGINNLQRAAYGYNRWAQSANRQYYNSDAAVGAWWTPQNPFDRAPQQLATVRGFKAGFEEEFLNIIKPVKTVTALNTVSDVDIGATETTFDTFFLPSLEQEYIVPQLSGQEGVYWEYWKQRLGLTSPQPQGSSGTNAAHIRYAYDAKTSAQSCRLRSAHRGYAGHVWFVNTSGSASYYSSATSAFRGCPACVIC